MSIESRMAARTIKAQLQRLMKVAKHQELTQLHRLLSDAIVEADIQCQAVSTQDAKPYDGRH